MSGLNIPIIQSSRGSENRNSSSEGNTTNPSNREGNSIPNSLEITTVGEDISTSSSELSEDLTGQVPEQIFLETPRQLRRPVHY